MASERLFANLGHGSAAADTDLDISDARLRCLRHLFETHAAGRTADTKTLSREVRRTQQHGCRQQNLFHHFGYLV